MAKKKPKKNINGLRNQKTLTSHGVEAPIVVDDIDEQSDHHDNEDGEWDAKIRFDSSKPRWDIASDSEDSDEGRLEEEVVETSEDDEWKNEGLQVGLMVLAIEIGDDPRDEDWIPDNLRRKHNARLAKGMFKFFK